MLYNMFIPLSICMETIYKYVYIVNLYKSVILILLVKVPSDLPYDGS